MVAPIDIVLSALSGLFGGAPNQRFVMEFPGRVLDEATYAWSVADVHPGPTETQVVAEAEFALSDDMFDTESGVTGGPNGRKVSTAYITVLKALMPMYAATERTFLADRQELREWLLEPVGTHVTDDGDGVPATRSRIELHHTLHDRYARAEAAWREEKNVAFEEARAGTDPVERASALDAYARWLANRAPVAEARIASLFDELVVNGYYHEVRETLGFLDGGSAAELLERAKASLRDSALSSLDETHTIYPVRLQPTDRRGDPTALADTPGVHGDWMPFACSFGEADTSEISTVRPSCSNSSVDVNSFLGGAPGDRIPGGARSDDTVSLSDITFDVGMNVAKVAIVRPWLDTSILAAAPTRYHVNGPDDAHTLVEKVLTGCPVAFVVARDITMRVEVASTSSKTLSDVRASLESASGGIFCFGVASSSSPENRSVDSTGSSGSVTVRLPQPQILGWFLQDGPTDASTNHRALPGELLPNRD